MRTSSTQQVRAGPAIDPVSLNAAFVLARNAFTCRQHRYRAETTRALVGHLTRRFWPSLRDVRHREPGHLRGGWRTVAPALGHSFRSTTSLDSRNRSRHSRPGGDVGISSIQSNVRTSAQYPRGHRMPPARPLLIISGDANWLRRQQCARMRKPSTQSVSALLTATIVQDPKHHIVRPPRSPQLHTPTGLGTLNGHSPSRSSQILAYKIPSIGRPPQGPAQHPLSDLTPTVG